MTQRELYPASVLADGVEVSRELLEKLHHKAHEECFIANSVKTEIVMVLGWWGKHRGDTGVKIGVRTEWH